MRPLEQALFALLQRAFDAKRIGPADRLELAGIHRWDGLSSAEVKDVYRAFLRHMWGDVIDDELLTHDERLILVLIVRALRLPWECAPFPEIIDELGIAS